MAFSKLSGYLPMNKVPKIPNSMQNPATISSKRSTMKFGIRIIIFTGMIVKRAQSLELVS